MFYLVHSSIVTQYHASENMSTISCGILFQKKSVVNKSPSDLYMISIKVANSFLAQVISCNLFHGTNLERTEIIAATSFDN